MTIILLTICGLITGLLSGLLGIGGGIISVPALYFLFSYTGLFDGLTMQVAASTSLAASLIISLFSSAVHYTKGSIRLSALKFLFPGLLLGCIAGALLAHLISSNFIRHIFAIGALLLGLYFAIPKIPHLHISSKPNRTLSLFGAAIGFFSSLLGIGGGTMTFPTLLFYGMDGKSSAATASCITTLSSFIGTISYLFINWKSPQLPDTFGYIYIPAFLTLSLSALLTTPLGVKLSHSLNINSIKRIFGNCLSLIGLHMLFN